VATDLYIAQIVTVNFVRKKPVATWVEEWVAVLANQCLAVTGLVQAVELQLLNFHSSLVIQVLYFAEHVFKLNAVRKLLNRKNLPLEVGFFVLEKKWFLQ
jgi:hypothetical protein